MKMSEFQHFLFLWFATLKNQHDTQNIQDLFFAAIPFFVLAVMPRPQRIPPAPEKDRFFLDIFQSNHG